MEHLANLIQDAYQSRSDWSPATCSADYKQAIEKAIQLLDQGTIRVAVKNNGTWHVNTWVKEAVLLYFKLQSNHVIEANYTQFFDKVPLKFQNLKHDQWQTQQTRIVPGAIVRHGAHIGANTILMPSFVNIGAHIDNGTMVDTWATVGSCAQIGKHVHLSGGVGIGGVLEPLQATPTIIEDHCFIGARSEIVEGVIVGEGAVISMGVYIGQSTPIYNRHTHQIHYGYVPPYAVVVPGSLPSKDGTHSLYAAIIVKQVDEKTRSKVSLNDLLRNLD